MSRTKLPARGPRVMHGASRLLAMARDLGGTFSMAGAQKALMDKVIPTPAPVAPQPAMEAASQLARRLAVAERKVDRMLRAIDLFEMQTQVLPAEHEFRKGAQMIFDNLRKQCVEAENDISKREQA